MENQSYFHLVEWQEDEMAVSIVPDIWLMPGTNKCWWPPAASSVLIRKGVLPQPSWECHEYKKIVASSVDWEKITRREKQYLEKSDLDSSDYDGKRRPVPRRQWSPPTVDRSPSPPSPVTFRDPGPSTRSPRRLHLTSSPLPPPPDRSLLQSTGFRRDVRSRSPVRRTSNDVVARPYYEAILKNQERLLAAVSQMQAELSSLRLEVKRQGQANEENSCPELPEGFLFPLSMKEDLQRLDDELKDEAVRKKLERYLTRIGGRTYKECVRNAGSQLLSASLQGQFNLNGQSKSGKAAITRLSFFIRTLYNAVHACHPIDNRSFLSYLAEWLSTWRDRMEGGKKNRVGQQNKDGVGQQNRDGVGQME